MVRATLARHRGREIKTLGDGFLATFDATTRAVRAAVEIVTQAKTMGLDVRAGVNIGEVEFGPTTWWVWRSMSPSASVICAGSGRGALVRGGEGTPC